MSEPRPEPWYNPEAEVLGRTVIQELPYKKYWTEDLVAKWSHTESMAEERETPVLELDLRDKGYGMVFIKDESDLSLNPTGTMKDRLARAYVYTYHSLAKFLDERIKEDPEYRSKLAYKVLPRFSLITSGNAGLALARAFRDNELPPPKLLIHEDVKADVRDQLVASGADVYSIDLSVNPFSHKKAETDPLTREQILKLTNNIGGRDITSAQDIIGFVDTENPGFFAYLNMARDVFSVRPTQVYVPFGSGMVFDCFVHTQRIFDSRDTDILGAEPSSLNSAANKLTAPVKPFLLYGSADAIALTKEQHWTGSQSGVYKIDENDISLAEQLFQEKLGKYGVRSESSAVAGLALYLKRWRDGKIKDTEKILVVNTGQGIG